MGRYLYKFQTLRNIRATHPNVKYYGAPRILRWLDFIVHDLPRGFYSQHGQDAVVLSEFFAAISDPAFPKVFLDIGCNDPVQFSNSLFFERYLGFKVIAIDALQEMQLKWREVRPGASFIHSAVGESPGSISFEVAVGAGNESMLSAVTNASDKIRGMNTETRTVPVRTLDDILAELDVSAIGIASIDVEGYEYAVLKGWKDTSRKIHILIVENNDNHELGTPDIRNHLEGRGYTYFGRIWNIDDVFVSEECLRLARRPSPV